MNTLLLVVGVIFLVSALIGYKRGLVKILASLVATIICIALVMMVSPKVSAWIQESTPLREKVQEKCVQMLITDTGIQEGDLQADISLEEQITMIEGAQLPQVIRQMLLDNNNVEVYTALGVQTFGEFVGAYVAKVIADVIAFLVTFIAVFIAIRVLIGMLGLLDKLPLIGGANHLAGGIIGAAMGILIIWILFIAITLLYNTSLGVACLEDIAESTILTKLYDGNILMNFITKF